MGDLGRCARVCRNWKVLIQANILWSKVNTNFIFSKKFSCVLFKYMNCTFSFCVKQALLRKLLMSVLHIIQYYYFCMLFVSLLFFTAEIENSVAENVILWLIIERKENKRHFRWSREIRICSFLYTV